jgi:transposase InsO family protein
MTTELSKNPQVAMVWCSTSFSVIKALGRVGAAGDNAAMESFFNLLQKNGPTTYAENKTP